MENKLCTSNVTRCGNNLMVKIPKEFIDEFPHGTMVAIVPVTTTIDIMKEVKDD